MKRTTIIIRVLSNTWVQVIILLTPIIIWDSPILRLTSLQTMLKVFPCSWHIICGQNTLSGQGYKGKAYLDTIASSLTSKFRNPLGVFSNIVYSRPRFEQVSPSHEDVTWNLHTGWNGPGSYEFPFPTLSLRSNNIIGVLVIQIPFECRANISFYFRKFSCFPHSWCSNESLKEQPLLRTIHITKHVHTCIVQAGCGTSEHI